MSTVVLMDSFTKASLLIEHEEEKAAFAKRTTEVPLSACSARMCTQLETQGKKRAVTSTLTQNAIVKARTAQSTKPMEQAQQQTQ